MHAFSLQKEGRVHPEVPTTVTQIQPLDCFYIICALRVGFIRLGVVVSGGFNPITSQMLCDKHWTMQFTIFPLGTFNFTSNQVWSRHPFAHAKDLGIILIFLITLLSFLYLKFMCFPFHCLDQSDPFKLLVWSCFSYLIKERLGCLNDLCCLVFPSFWKVLSSDEPPLLSSAVCVFPLLTILHTPVPAPLFSSTPLSLSSLHTALHMCSWGCQASSPGPSPWFSHLWPKSSPLLAFILL